MKYEIGDRVMIVSLERTMDNDSETANTWDEGRMGQPMEITRVYPTSKRQYRINVVGGVIGGDVFEYQIAPMKGKRGRPSKVKPTLKKLYVIYKKGCINYETTVKGTLKKAKRELKDLGDEYVLFEAKPILCCVTETKTTFKKLTEVI